MSKFIIGYPEGRRTASRNRRSIPPGGFSSIFGAEPAASPVRTPTLPRRRTAVDAAPGWTDGAAWSPGTPDLGRRRPSQQGSPSAPRRYTADQGSCSVSDASPRRQRTPAQEIRDRHLGNGTPPSWWGSGAASAQYQQIGEPDPVFPASSDLRDHHQRELTAAAAATAAAAKSDRPPSARGVRSRPLSRDAGGLRSAVNQHRAQPGEQILSDFDRVARSPYHTAFNDDNREMQQLRVLVEHLTADVARLKVQLDESESGRRQELAEHNEKYELALAAAAEARSTADEERTSRIALEDDLEATRQRALTLEHDLDEARTAEKKASAKYKKLKEQVKETMSKRPVAESGMSKKTPTTPQSRPQSKAKYAFGSTMRESAGKRPEPRRALSRANSTRASRMTDASSEYQSSSPTRDEFSNITRGKNAINGHNARDAVSEQQPGRGAFSNDPLEEAENVQFDNSQLREHTENSRDIVYNNYASQSKVLQDDDDPLDQLYSRIGYDGASHAHPNDHRDAPALRDFDHRDDDFAANNYADYLLEEASRKADESRNEFHDVNSWSPNPAPDIDDLPVGTGSSQMQDMPEDSGARAPCNICGRLFSVDRLAKHISVCAKASNKKRKPIDGTKIRVQGTESEKYMRNMSKDIKPKKSNWKAKSEALRAALKAARDPSAAPAPAFEDPSLVPCDSCGRTFSETAAARHIPLCRSKKGIRNPSKNRSSRFGR